jgi:ribosomal protein S18 acetylase RimI-like enzyme
LGKRALAEGGTVEEIRIIPAEKADIPLMAESRLSMFAEMFPEEDFSAIEREFLDAALRYYAEKLISPDELSLVAKLGDRAIGCGTIMFQQRPPSVKNLKNLFGYILNIYVRPEFRRHGAATRIMEALMREARVRGVKRIGLHASRAGANVYRKLGFSAKESYMEAEV